MRFWEREGQKLTRKCSKNLEDKAGHVGLYDSLGNTQACLLIMMWLKLMTNQADTHDLYQQPGQCFDK